MKNWLHTFFNGYPWVEFLIAWVGIGLAAVAVNFAVDKILELLGDKRRIQFRFVKSIFWGLAIPTIGIWMWFSSYDNPFNEYKLITSSESTKGLITKVEPESDLVEYNDSRRSAVVYFYYYEFNFTLPNGKFITSGGKEGGDIPNYLTNVDNVPYPVEVEYLTDNPEINRVKGMSSGNKTIYEWFRYPILMGVVVLLICSYFGYLIFKGGLKDYKAELSQLSI
ncbi:MAG: hypothetical protein Q8M15_14410 [Bacteroidota bacterium]|nr:hypothetical protein [Bacteroidota bacterium]